MFEHMKNYQALIKKISSWLKGPESLLFIHIFCHRTAVDLETVRYLLRKLTRLENFSASGVPVMVRKGVRRFSELPPPVCSRVSLGGMVFVCTERRR